MCDAVKSILTAPMKLHNKVKGKVTGALGLEGSVFDKLDLSKKLNEKMIKTIEGDKPAPGVPAGSTPPSGLSIPTNRRKV